MNVIYRISPVICICTLICCCAASSKKIVYDKILFGKGGGFTGKYDEYYLSKNGNIYKKNATTNEFIKIKDISRKETNNIFKQVDTDTLFEMSFNHPYNITCYIEIVKGDVINRIVWGDMKNPPPITVTQLFDKLMALVSIERPVTTDKRN